MLAHVIKIDVGLAPQMKKDLLDQGFELTEPPHAFFQAKKKGVICTLYKSGKLMVQGKDKAEWIEFYLEPLVGDFSFTHNRVDVDKHPRIGIDEAGKGDFFGPLVIAGLFADEAGIDKLIKMGVTDSKKMTDKLIARLAPQIEREFPHAIIRLFPKRYNELYESFGNLNHLLGWGHATAIENLHKDTGCHKALIDQFANEWVVEKALKKKNLEIDLTQRHKGEEDPVVAGASVLARHAFVKGIEKLGDQVEMILPKGASRQVVLAGKKLVNARGPEILREVGKLHFKTRQEILQQHLL